MKDSGFLWIDLRRDTSRISHFMLLSKEWLIFRVSTGEEIAEKIKLTFPHFLCFEFDYPDLEGLRAIKRTKLAFPFLPILMITHYHSEELAVWAFRARVWDYMVHPLSLEEIVLRLETLLRIRNEPNSPASRTMYSSKEFIPIELRFCANAVKQGTTLPAISYIEKNFGETVRVKSLADLCSMTAAQFSLRFKRENGVSIRDYLIQFRINKAKQMLENPYSSVTDIAFAVGFNDLSHFTRLFKRYSGSLPSHYKRQFQAIACPNSESKKESYSFLENT
jgi:YesN/AraC family two-component response regulator